MFTHVSDDRKRIGFSVAQFNILAKVLAQSDHFPGVKKERLQWSNRKQVLMKNIEDLLIDGRRADILCLEELSNYWEFFKDELAKPPFLYNSVYVKRPAITKTSWSGLAKTDGCGIFYSLARFKLLSQTVVNYRDHHDRVALIVALECIGELDGNGIIIISNTHLYWDITKIDDQMSQLRFLHESIGIFFEQVKNEFDIDCYSVPVIIAGDFNNLPSSELYKYMHHEFLYDSHQMLSSYRKYNLPGYNSLTNEEIEENILQGIYEPSCTSVTHRRAKTIDYIFYSSKYLTLDLSYLV